MARPRKHTNRTTSGSCQHHQPDSNSKIMAGRIPAEEQRRRKNERERERKRKKKDEIMAKDRERKKRKAKSMTEEEKKRHNEKAAERMRVRRAAMSSGEHTMNLERKRKAYYCLPQKQKQEYLMN